MEKKIMRIVHYYVINKETKRAVFMDCRPAKANAFIAEQTNPDNFVVVMKWKSI